MGTVKFFPNQGGAPTPPEYLNYVGTLSGSYGNARGLTGAGGEIYIPLNNYSKNNSSTSNKNTTELGFANSGQDVDYYFYGVNLALSNIVGSDDFTLNVYVDDVLIETRTENFDPNNYGVISIVTTPIITNDKILIGLVTDSTSFDIVSCNNLFYCTGNIVPPPSCEYFQFVASTNGGGVLVVTSPIVGLYKQTPLIFQANNWVGGTAGSRVPRTRNWNNLSSDSTATTIQGQTYYVELTLSQPYGTNKKIYMYFGRDIQDRTSTVGIPYFDGNLTTPQGMYLQWNPNSVADPLFMFIGESNAVSPYNGTLTFKVGTQYCPI